MGNPVIYASLATMAMKAQGKDLPSDIFKQSEEPSPPSFTLDHKYDDTPAEDILRLKEPEK